MATDFHMALRSELEDTEGITAKEVVENRRIVFALRDRTRDKGPNALLEHIERATQVTEAYGQAADLSPHAHNILMLAALSHDNGKLAYPHLVGKYPLTESEMAEYRGHVTESVRLLNELRGTHGERVRTIVGDHHERPHGKGYPMSKKGDELTPSTLAFITCDVAATVLWPAAGSPRHALNPQQRLDHLLHELAKGQNDGEFGRGSCDLFMDFLINGKFDPLEIPYRNKNYPIGDLGINLP